MFTLAFRYALSDGIPRRSFLVALVVGTILNLINQGDALFGPAQINWIKIGLTYLVPYAVSTYGAVSYLLSRQPSMNSCCPPNPVGNSSTDGVVAQSEIRCPHCGTTKAEQMPIDACQIVYRCTGCGVMLRPKFGDCCVFCSYGSVPCPPIQAARAQQI